MFLLWILICLVVAAVSIKRPWMAPSAVLATWVLVPWVARELLIGPAEAIPIVLAPPTWMALTSLSARLLRGRPESNVQRSFAGRPLLLGALAALFVVPLVLSRGEGLAFLIDQVASPLIVFYLVVDAVSREWINWVRLRTVFLGLAGLQCLVAVLHFGGLIGQLHEGGLQTQYWYVTGFDRETGTLDHPLVLATLLVGATPLTKGLSARAQASMLVLFATGVVLTQSRLGLLLVGLGVLSLFASRRIRPATLFALLGAGMFMGGLLASNWASRIIGRFVDDNGSSGARTAALDAFRAYDLSVLSGRGPGASNDVARELGLITSFESWPLMYGIDYGLAVTAIYFGAMTWMIWRSRAGAAGASTAAALTLVMTCFFSSLAVQSATATILWFVLGLAVGGCLKSREVHETQGQCGNGMEIRLS